MPPQAEVEALRAKARGGDARAKWELGLALMGRNDERSLTEARTWLRQAMQAGYLEAQTAYAALLLHGAGGPADQSEGRRLLLDAAARGDVGANVTLSDAYLNGAIGLPRDPAKALLHMRAAAGVAGPSRCHLEWRLGMMHLRGVGTAQDAAEAYRWVVRGADKGSVDGMISRAVMLATGEGVAKNPTEARTWYERAARLREEKWAHALRSLGGMLVMGEGGPVDLPRGFGYLLAAHAGGDERAGRLIETLRDRITPEVEAAAVAIAREWVPARPKSD